MSTIIHTVNSVDVRIEALWPFPVIHPAEAMLEAFQDAPITRLPAPIQALIENWDCEDQGALMDGPSEDAECAWLALLNCALSADPPVTGWICYAARPVFHTEHHFSWGYRTHGFFFAATPEEAIALAVAEVKLAAENPHEG